MKIFITGATGYIGHQLTLKLARQNNIIHILVRNLTSPFIPVHPNIIVFVGDITNRESMLKALAGCEQVFHVAALVNFFSKDPELFYKINVEGTRNLLNASIDAGVKKLVFTSSCAVLGASVNTAKTEKDPRIESFSNNYDFTKFLAENLVREYVHKGLFTVIVSPSKVYGPGIETHSISINSIINRFIKNKITFIPRPSALLNTYCFIDDIVNGHMLAMKYGMGGEKYILGGEIISFKNFFQQLRMISGSKARVIETPRSLVKCWAIGQWLHYLVSNKEPFVTIKGIKHVFANKAYSSEKAIKELGYQITPLKEGLIQTIKYLQIKNHA